MKIIIVILLVICSVLIWSGFYNIGYNNGYESIHYDFEELTNNMQEIIQTQNEEWKDAYNELNEDWYDKFNNATTNYENQIKYLKSLLDKGSDK